MSNENKYLLKLLFGAFITVTSSVRAVLIPQSVADAYHLAQRTHHFVMTAAHNEPFVEVDFSEIFCSSLDHEQASIEVIHRLTNLTELSFVNVDFAQMRLENVNYLFECVQNLGDLYSLKFQETTLGMADRQRIERIVGAIRQVKKLRSLIFEENRLYDLTADTASLFKQMFLTTIESLTLVQSDTEEGDVYLAAFAAGLKDMRLLRQLIISIGVDLPEEIVHAIGGNKCVLTHLALISTPVDHLSNSAWNAFIDVLYNQRELEYLELISCYVSHIALDRFNRFCNVIQVLRSLRTLYLTFNEEDYPFYDSDELTLGAKWRVLALALVMLPELRTLALHGVLFNEDIKEQFWHMISDISPCMTRLTKFSINISNLPSTRAGWQYLSQAVARMNITDFALVPIKTGYSFINIDSESWQYFLQLCGHGSFQRIDLRGCHFTQRQKQELAAHIRPWIYTGVIGEDGLLIGAMPH